MSQRRILIGVGLLAIVGSFLWWQGKSKDAPNEKQETVASTKPPTKVSKKKAQPQTRSQGGEVEVWIDDDPEGHLRLEGQVIDSTEDPVGGAIVSIDSQPPRTTKTEADGSFAFDKLVAKSYTLVARAPEGVAGPVRARLSEENEPVILSLVAGSTVSVHVSARSGPVSNASVELRGVDYQTGSTNSDGQAVFYHVPIGRYRVVAKAEGYAPGSSRLAISRPGAENDVQLQLKQGARVSGVVVDPQGSPLEGARVMYRGVSNWSQGATNERLDAVISKKDGSFSIQALPQGSFRITARADGYAPGYSDLITLDGETETTGVEVRMEAGATLRGKVVNKSGEPVPAARVRVSVAAGRARGPRGRGGGVRQVFSDENGGFVLEGLRRKPHNVMATHESASSDIHNADLSVEPYDLSMDITLNVDGVIAGVVVDSNDEPVEGAQVSAFPDSRAGARRSRAEWRLRGFTSELSDSGGRFKISGLKPEEAYRVRASPATASGRSRIWLTEGTAARAGDTDLKITLPADGGVKGKVAFANGDAPGIFTVSVGWRRGTPFSSKDGKFELADLPPQEFSVTVQGPGFDKLVLPGVEVLEGEVKDLGTITVKQGRKVTGQVVGPNGSPVEGATVRAGRMILGDGSTSQAAFSRNPRGRDTKTTTSDENGKFVISGIGLGDLSVVADHEEVGRSKNGRSVPYDLRMSNESIIDLTLTLQEVGMLQGTVTRQGEPAADVGVLASSLRSPAVTFSVSTGPDGKYRFDRLVPDTYQVRATGGGSPMSGGLSFYSEHVEIVAGETATLDIEAGEGGTNLTIKLVADVQLGFSRVHVIGGVLTAKTARELEALMGEGTGFQSLGLSFGGRPAQASGLQPGSYSVCAIVYPPEIERGPSTLDYMKREGDNLPVQCKKVQVRDQPEQEVTLQVVAPEFVPLPEDTEDEG
jgi:protocatechuate 3,4-dioxygenase beta subunit